MHTFQLYYKNIHCELDFTLILSLLIPPQTSQFVSFMSFSKKTPNRAVYIINQRQRIIFRRKERINGFQQDLHFRSVQFHLWIVLYIVGKIVKVGIRSVQKLYINAGD